MVHGCQALFEVREVSRLFRFGRARRSVGRLFDHYSTTVCKHTWLGVNAGPEIVQKVDAPQKQLTGRLLSQLMSRWWEMRQSRMQAACTRTFHPVSSRSDHTHPLTSHLQILIVHCAFCKVSQAESPVATVTHHSNSLASPATSYWACETAPCSWEYHIAPLHMLALVD